MDHSHDTEIKYRKIFERLSTRKKFSIRSIDGEAIVIEEDQEICGQKEPKLVELSGEKELDKFITEENQFERDIKSQLSGNDMPYR